MIKLGVSRKTNPVTTRQSRAGSRVMIPMILDRFPELLALFETEKLQLAEELYGTALKEFPHLSDEEIHAE